jgi:hypothetical protein
MTSARFLPTAPIVSLVSPTVIPFRRRSLHRVLLLLQGLQTGRWCFEPLLLADKDT